MSDPQCERWAKLLSERSRTQGLRLGDDVVRELAAHIADLYAAARESGQSDADATAGALRELERGAYVEVAARRRAAQTASRLLERAPSTLQPPVLAGK